MTSPYDPPQAPVASPADPGAAPWKGILLGLVVDMGGTILWSIVVVVTVSIWQRSTGADPGLPDAALDNPSPFSPLGLALEIPGLFLSWLGGYTCMRLVRRETIGCGIVLALLSAGLGGWIVSRDGASGSSELVVTLISFVATLVGAWHGRVRLAER